MEVFKKLLQKFPWQKWKVIHHHYAALHKDVQNSKAVFMKYAPVPYDVLRRLIEEYSKKEQEELVWLKTITDFSTFGFLIFRISFNATY